MEEHHNQKQCDSHHSLEWRLQVTGAARLISKSNVCIKNAALLSPTNDPRFQKRGSGLSHSQERAGVRPGEEKGDQVSDCD